MLSLTSPSAPSSISSRLFDIPTLSSNRCFKLSLSITSSYLSLQSLLLLKSYSFQWKASLFTQLLRSNTVGSFYALFSHIPSSNPIQPNPTTLLASASKQITSHHLHYHTSTKHATTILQVGMAQLLWPYPPPASHFCAWQTKGTFPRKPI